MNESTQKLTVLAPTDIRPGQMLRIHERIQDVNAKGEPRERTQIFEGLVLAVRGMQASKSFTIRKETGGFGVEKIFPIMSPAISKIELVKAYRVRRAKLTFVQDFGRKLKELIVKK